MAGKVPRADVRIGHGARAEATGRLDKALREGRIDLAEYERRVVVVQAAKVRKDLTPAVADLADRISPADREQALVRLAGALTDGRLSASAYAEAEELVHRAVTYADIEAVVGGLEAKASHAERDQAVARIEAAVAGGLLDPAEQHDRLAAVRRATTDAHLAALVADLPAGAGSSPRASHADREAVAAQLQDAVEAGLLELPEFDERVRAVYAARLRDELERVVADLPSPSTSAEPPAPPAEVVRPRRTPSARVGRIVTLTGAFGTIPLLFFVIFLFNMGFVFTGIVAAVVSVIVAFGLMAWGMGIEEAAVALKLGREQEQEEVTPVKEDSIAETVEEPDKPVLSGHEAGLVALTGFVLPDGTPVAITGGRDNTAKVWDLTDGSLRHTLRGHTHDVYGVAATVLPDGVPVVVTVSVDRTARVWDLTDGSLRGSPVEFGYEPQEVRCLSLADGTPVAVAYDPPDAIQLWDLRDGTTLASLTSDSFDPFLELFFPVVLADGTPVALATDWDGPIKVVDLKDGKTKFQLLGHTRPVRWIDTTVLPDGTPVAVSVSEDKTVRVWDLRRGTLRHTIAGMVHYKEVVVCTSLPDGTPVAVAGDYHENTAMWDLRDGSELPCGLALEADLLAAVALPDRTLILCPAEDEQGVDVHPLN